MKNFSHSFPPQPLACSLHAVDLGQVFPSLTQWPCLTVSQIGWDDVVVVSGCGPLGLGMVAGARKKVEISYFCIG